MSRIERSAARAEGGRIARQVIVFVSSTVLSFTIVLIAMTALIRATTGWDTVIVTTGSMSPTIRPGDVLFVDEPPDELVGQQTVITFETADGDLVTHRVFSVDRLDRTYVTKGDANPSPDSDLVTPDQVVGVAWLVVPYLGLPAVWWEQGNFVAVAALLLVGLLSVATSALTRRPRTDEDREERISTGAQRGIVRVRLVVGLLITVLVLARGHSTRSGALPADIDLVVGTIVALIAVTAVARFRSTRTVGAAARRLALVELAADTVVVIVFVAATGTSSIGWILMALPIIEAAIHFRLTGAFVHWIVMSGASVASLLWTSRVSDEPRSTAITNLEQLVDRLGLLLLVVIPASYLAEQLLGDVLAQRHATRRARNRSAIIERVTDAGVDVSRLGVDVFPRLTAAAVDLGFDAADCWTGDGRGDWHILSKVSADGVVLPGPQDPAGGLRPADLLDGEVFVSTDDPDPDSARSLDAAGLGVMVRLTLVSRESMHVVLRAGAIRLGDDPTSQVMALRLLAAQAAVALQNDQLLAELKATQIEIEHRAHYDSLTDLPNRSFLGTLLADALGDDEREDRTATVMFLDLNGFKAINDTLGHSAGDALLSTVADRLRAAVGERGTIARLGGDEFTVLITGRDADFSNRLAERIHRLLDEPVDLGGEVAHVSTSIGIADSTAGITASELLRRADVAMYAAKATGGTQRTARYETALDEADRRTALLSRSLPAAIANDDLYLVYQPMVEVASGAIAGIEATVRWVHPELGPVPTVEITEIAESGSCLDEFNRWVLDRATSEISTVIPVTDPRITEPFIAVNVSPSEFALPTLAHNVQAALVTSGLDPRLLTIELSERAATGSPDAMDNADRLRALGVRLALDDFGEGPTSLTAIHRLPVDVLKLDGVFVRNASTSAPDRTMLSSVVRLAHELGFTVVAEGVENTEQMELVEQVDADLVQGYGLFRPMQISELHHLFHNRPALREQPPVSSLGFGPVQVDDGERIALRPPALHTGAEAGR